MIVNGKNLKFKSEKVYTTACFRFGAHSDRYISEWSYQEKNKNYTNKAIQKTKLSASFSISKDVRHILKKYKYPQKIEKEARNYASEENMHFAWAFADRLYLVLPFADSERASGIECRINGYSQRMFIVSCRSLKEMKRVCWFCDITEFVKYGCQNDVEVYIRSCAKNMFLGGYLVYPKGKKSNEVYNDQMECKNINKFLNSNLPVFESNHTNGGVRIIQAKWSRRYFEEHTEIRLKVILNKSYEDVRRVVTSCPITIDAESKMTMNTDRELLYNQEKNLWETKFLIGSRNFLIIDDAFVHIKAIDKKYFSDTYILPIEWKF